MARRLQHGTPTPANQLLECAPSREDDVAQTVGRPAPAATAFKPFVPDEARLPELTIRAVLLGSLLGIVFGASSVYLALRVGLTVSASVPIAVLSITIFRALSKRLGGRASIPQKPVGPTTGPAGGAGPGGGGLPAPGAGRP